LNEFVSETPLKANQKFSRESGAALPDTHQHKPAINLYCFGIHSITFIYFPLFLILINHGLQRL